MLKIEFIDNELFYYVFTNVGNNLILVTRDGKLATQINAALKNKRDDSSFRLALMNKRGKAAW
jgi:hypothetical protein